MWMSDQRREGVDRRVGRVDEVSSVVRRWKRDEVVKLWIELRVGVLNVGVSLGSHSDLKGVEISGWCIARHSGREQIMVAGVAC